MTEETQIELFERWFVDPIEKLKELPNGNGGFIVFIAALALYERLIVARLKSADMPINLTNQHKEIEHDLKMTPQQRAIFWDVFRIGLLHHAMPKAGKTGYIFDSTYSAYPEFKLLDSQPVICIDPWKFADKIISNFQANPILIDISESFPFPFIAPKPTVNNWQNTDAKQTGGTILWPKSSK